jgi:hypothetical protein
MQHCLSFNGIPKHLAKEVEHTSAPTISYSLSSVHLGGGCFI